jgi:hypothetical protein
MRIILSLVFALSVVVAPRAALNLPAASGVINFGDNDIFASMTQLSIAATVRMPTPLGPIGNIVGQWGSGESTQSWTLFTSTVDRVGFCTNTPTAFGDYYCIESDASLITAGATHRILVIRNLGADLTWMYVDGVSVPFSCTTCQPITTGTRNSTTAVTIGRTGAGGVGLTADYSEVAVWNTVVPTWVGEAYGKGMSPNIYRTGGIFYVPLKTAADTRDLWSGMVGTLTSGTVADHPRVFNVQPPQ